MAKTLLKFDVAAALGSPEAIAEYMTAALETQDAGYIAHAIGIVARAKGMNEIASAAGLSRDHLYRSFAEDGNPPLKSLIAVMNVLGVQLSATAESARHDSPA